MCRDLKEVKNRFIMFLQPFTEIYDDVLEPKDIQVMLGYLKNNGMMSENVYNYETKKQ